MRLTCVLWLLRLYSPLLQALVGQLRLQPARSLFAHTLQVQGTRWLNRQGRPMSKSLQRTSSSSRLESSFGFGASSLGSDGAWAPVRRAPPVQRAVAIVAHVCL